MATHSSRPFSRSVGLLAGISLLVSLFAIAPPPIKAADPAPDYLATFEACPEDVIPDADFSDVSARHDNAGDIDCIAYYGITKGTSATTYSPDDPVIREHMALFLIRLAKRVGIRVPAPPQHHLLYGCGRFVTRVPGRHQPVGSVRDNSRGDPHNLRPGPRCQPW